MKTKRFVSGMLLAHVLAVAAAPAARADDATVTISGRLSPASVTVVQGDTVRWRNADDDRHRVRSYEAPGDAEFDSGSLEPGERYAFRFTTPGTYRYYDDRERDDRAYWGTITVKRAQAAPTSPDSGGGTTDGGTSAPASGSVEIVDRAFSPRRIEIRAGGTVSWVNRDDREHTATADDGSFNSSTLGSGARFSRRFRSAGTFGYFCAIHPEMRGTVLVRGAGGAAPPPARPAVRRPAPVSKPSVAGALNIKVVDFAFRPASARATAGTTVVWTNGGAAPHTITAQGGAFDSGMLQPGARFRRTFTRATAISYFCALHPQMRGTIVIGSVKAPPSPVPAASVAARESAAPDEVAAIAAPPSERKGRRAPLLGAAQVGALVLGVPAGLFALIWLALALPRRRRTEV